jgi:hypothetical protein
MGSFRPSPPRGDHGYRYGPYGYDYGGYGQFFPGAFRPSPPRGGFSQFATGASGSQFATGASGSQFATGASESHPNYDLGLSQPTQTSMDGRSWQKSPYMYVSSDILL